LLLLEADQLPEDAQAELLGLLSIHELGLRTLATSQRSLIELAGQSGYDRELAQVLSTIVVELPSLRDRPEDISLVAQFFIERHNAGKETLGTQSETTAQWTGFTTAAMEQLMAYTWPGNIDELRNVVRECLATSEPPMIDTHQLPQRIKAGLDAALNPVDQPTSLDLETHLADVERDVIRLALRRSGGNKSQAAKSLGVSRARLLRRIEQLGISGKHS
jgi:DNA-binding NtrC family response regulator